MRDILFRGKRCDNGEWCYGSYVEAARGWHNRGIHKDWIIVSARANGGWFALGEKHAVVTDTVGQHTGLTDKHGVNIFEGDIVRCTNYHGDVSGDIVFYNGTYYLACSSGFSDEYLFNCGNIEVIGSIHDNGKEDV